MRDILEGNSYMKKRILSLVAVLALLSACSGLDDRDEGKMALQNAAPVQPTYAEAARELSDGSVQIFPLDGPPMAASPYAAEAGGVGDDGGRPAADDRNVVVYPFDEGGAPRSSGSPGIMPPVSPSFVSPFGPRSDYDPRRDGAAAEGSVYFAHGSSRIDSAGGEAIKKAAGFAAEEPGRALLVEGHASARAQAQDPVQAHIANLKVSMDRAYNVSRQLMKEGVPAASIDTRAYGDTRPAQAEGGAADESSSRRVDIYSTRARSAPPESSYPYRAW